MLFGLGLTFQSFYRSAYSPMLIGLPHLDLPDQMLE